MARNPTQVVSNLHESMEDLQCLEIDERSCKLNCVIEGNAHDVPVFSPLDEIKKPVEGVIADYFWVDIGHVRSLLASYIDDGTRWYDRV